LPQVAQISEIKHFAIEQRIAQDPTGFKNLSGLTRASQFPTPRDGIWLTHN
jgi:hypothetical protein